MSKQAYVIVSGTPNQKGTGPMVGVVSEGQTGYYATDYDWGDEASAKRICEEMNADMGIDVAEATAMKISSMFPHSRITADDLRG